MTKSLAETAESFVKNLKDATTPCRECRWLGVPWHCERCLFAAATHSYWEAKDDVEVS